MLSKAIVKYVQSLHHKKFREEHGVFVAEGPKVVTDLLHSGKFLCKVIYAVDSWLDENTKLLVNISAENKLPVNEADLEKISLLHTPNKVLAVFYKKQEEEIELKKKLNLMLDDIRDPGNFGTIIRIADWFDIKNIICSEDCVEQYNPKVVQASMGSLSRVNIVYTDLKKFIKSNKEIDLYAATLNGIPLSSFDQITEGLILIGNESKGVNSELVNLAIAKITIPKFGKAESLNAAVAAGIILFHLVK